MGLLSFYPSSLRNRVLTLTLTGFLLTALALTFLVFRYLHNESTKMLVIQQQEIISMLVTRMESELNKRVTYLERFADTLHTRKQLLSNNQIQNALKNENYLQALFNGGLVVLNKQAISIVDFPMVPNRTGINFSGRSHVKQVLEERKSVISRPLIGKGLQTPLFVINTPVLSPDNQVLGFIFGVNVLSENNVLATVSKESFDDKGGRTIIIDPNLEIFVIDSERDVALQSYLNDHTCSCVKMVIDGIGSGITTTTEGDEIIFASDTIDTMGWTVIRTYPLSSAMSTINDLTFKVAVLTLALILLMSFIIAYLLKRQLTPLKEASLAMQRMAEGKQSDRMLSVTREDEVGHLIQAFNRLHSSRQRYEQALKDSEERYRLTMEATGTGIWSWDLITDTITWNEQCFKMLGYEDHAFKLDRASFRALVHPDDQVEFFIRFMPQMLENTASEIELRLKTKSGNWLWIQSRGKPIQFNLQHRPQKIAGTLVNIDKQKQTEQLRLAAAAFETSDAIMIVDTNSHIIKVNNAFTQITGYSHEDVINNTPAILRSGVHDEEFYDKLWSSLKNTGQWQGEVWNRRKDGELYIAWMNINTLFHEDGTVYQRVAVFSDITEKKRSEELIWKQANFDPLTGLPNRRMFLEKLSQEILLANRSRTKLALLFLDLDRFKEINDTLGHNIGDKLLIEVARRFKKLVRSSDIVARLGGDEFTLILPQITSNLQIEQVSTKILNVLKLPFNIEQQQLFISASIGATLYPQDADNAEQLIQNADQAMYAAKESGRNQMHYFTPSMQEQANQRVNIVKKLRRAIEQQQFCLYYQPIVNLQDMTVSKAEALIRWNDPDKGLVMPDHFIPEAEDSGLILEIGEWVFDEALRQVRLWRKTMNPDFQISINTSPAQFETNSHPGADPEHWISKLKSFNVNGSAVCIEITERLLMDTSEETRSKLLKLRDANIQVSLDDFGTGHSSLAYLKQLDIDYLKIDRSFVQHLTPDSSNLVLCNAIIVMAHTLGLKVIAEGIETEEQHRLLRQAGCDFGQGYFYSESMPEDKFKQWITGVMDHAAERHSRS